MSSFNIPRGSGGSLSNILNEGGNGTSTATDNTIISGGNSQQGITAGAGGDEANDNSILSYLLSKQGLTILGLTGLSSLIGYLIYSSMKNDTSTTSADSTSRTNQNQVSTTQQRNRPQQQQQNTATGAPASTTTTDSSKRIVYSLENLEPSSASNWKDYQHNKLGIQFKHPPSYQIEMQNQFGGLITLNFKKTDSSLDDFDATVMTMEESQLNPRDYMKQNLSMLQSQQTTYTILSENDIVVNGRPGIETSMEINISQSETLRIYAACVRTGGDPSRLLLLQHISKDVESFDIETVREILKTIQFREPEQYGKLYIQTKNGIRLQVPNMSYYINNNQLDIPQFIASRDQPKDQQPNIEACFSAYDDKNRITKEVTIYQPLNKTNADFSEFLDQEKQRIQNYKDYSDIGSAGKGHYFKYSRNVECIPASITKQQNQEQAIKKYDFLEYLVRDENNYQNYVICCRSLPSHTKQFQTSLIPNLSNLQFTDQQFDEPKVHYENSEHNFSLTQPIREQTMVKETPTNDPIVDILCAYDENATIPTETMVSITQPQTPVNSLVQLKQSIKDEIRMSQSTIKKDQDLKIAGQDAYNIVYTMAADPYTGTNFTFFITVLIYGSSVISLKSYTTEQTYNDSVEAMFRKTHQSFTFS